MTAWLLALVPQYGLWLLAATTFLSCLALPFPASILMLTAGGFAAAGDLVLWQAFLAAAAGGIAGDQLGYWAGRGLGTPALARLRRDPARDRMLARADALMQRRGIMAIFLSRWLVSPLGQPDRGQHVLSLGALHVCRGCGRSGLGGPVCRRGLRVWWKCRSGQRHAGIGPWPGGRAGAGACAGVLAFHLEAGPGRVAQPQPLTISAA